MKKIAYKLITVLLIVIISFNTIFATPVQADILDSIGSALMSALEGILTSIVALFARIASYIPFGLAIGIDSLLAMVAYMDGPAKGAGNIDTSHITPFDILFNKVQLLDANFFEISKSTYDQSSLAYQFRTGIAGWYYFMRMIAISLLLVVLIYVGIRMLLSTVATERAMYKKMLMDWVSSVLLVFLLNYIMVFTITVSNGLVDAISLTSNNKVITQTYESFLQTGLGRDAALPEEGEEVDVSGVDALTARILFIMLVFQTLGLLVVYFNRMLKLAFLTIVAPLVTITYSIDKIGDGKAQALEAWLKEYVYTTLIQPFHCIIYMVFVTSAFKLLEIKNPEVSNEQLAIAIIAMVCLHFVTNAEKIVRKIFNFQNDDSDTSLGAAVMMGGALVATSKNFGTNLKSGINGFRDMRLNMKQGAVDRKVGRMAARAYVFNKTLGRLGSRGEERSQMTFTDTKTEARARLNDKETKRYLRKSGGGQISDNSEELKQEMNKVKNILPGITEREAKSIARRNIAQRQYNNRNFKARTVNKAKGAIKNAKLVLGDSVLLKGASSVLKANLAADAGIFMLGATYGTGQNLGNALAMGVASTVGTGNLLKNTIGNATKTAANNVRAAGAQNQEQAAAVIAKAMARNESDEDSKDELEKIMRDVEDALKDCGLNDGEDTKKVATNIRNVIKRGVQQAETEDDLRRTIDYATHQALASTKTNTYDSGSHGDNPRGVDGTAALLASVGNLADYLNDRQIYESINNSGKIGASGDLMAEMIVGQFEVLPDSAPSEATFVNRGNAASQVSTEERSFERDLDADNGTVESIQHQLDDLKQQENELVEEAILEARLKERSPSFYGKETDDDAKAEILAREIKETAKRKLRDSGVAEQQARLEQQLKQAYEKMVESAEVHFDEVQTYAEAVKKIDADFAAKIQELEQSIQQQRASGLEDDEITEIDTLESVRQRRKDNIEVAKQVESTLDTFAGRAGQADVANAYGNAGRDNLQARIDSVNKLRSEIHTIATFSVDRPK